MGIYKIISRHGSSYHWRSYCRPVIFPAQSDAGDADTASAQTRPPRHQPQVATEQNQAMGAVQGATMRSSAADAPIREARMIIGATAAT